MVEERGNEAPSPCIARSADEWLLHAQKLVPLALHKSRKVQTFPSRWKAAVSKLEVLPSCLSDLSSHPCFSKNALCKEQLQGVVLTLNESMEMAERCLGERYEGKLKMQSDLDLLLNKLDLNIRDCRVLVKTGILGEATLPLSISKSSNSEAHSSTKELLARLQIGHLEAKHRAVDALLGAMKEDEKSLISVIGRSNVAALINLLTASTSPVIREKVITIIYCLIESGNCENWLVAEGVLPSLIRLVESGNTASKEKALISLERLSGSPEVAHLITTHGGIVPLIDLCACHGSALQTSAACALKNISAVPEVHQILAEEGVVEAMIDLLDNATSIGLKEYAAHCLQNMTSSDENLRRTVISKGGFGSLLAYINNSLLPQEAAVGSVRNLVGMVSWESLVSAGLLPGLVHVMRFGSLGAQQAAMSTICRICGSDEAKKLIGEVEMIPFLINSLELKSDSVREVAAQAMSSLITVQENYKEVKMNDKSVPNMVQLLDPNPRNSAKKYAVLCLLRLSSSKKCRKVMVAYGAIGYLKKLSERDIPGSKKLLERLEGGKLRSLFS